MVRELGDFCCSQFYDEVVTNGDGALMQIGEYEVENPSDIQKLSLHYGNELRDLEFGDIYLYNTELRQIFGDPFNYCPYCGKPI